MCLRILIPFKYLDLPPEQIIILHEQLEGMYNIIEAKPSPALVKEAKSMIKVIKKILREE